MSIFLIACAGLVLASAIFLFAPARTEHDEEEAGPGEAGQANLEWYQLRQRELLEETSPERANELQRDIELRLLEDQGAEQAQAHEEVRRDRFPRWLLLPLIAVGSGLMYYQLGSAADVVIEREMRAVAQQTDPEALAALMQSIETRYQQRPENQHYLALLGRYTMDQQEYAKAAELYGTLASGAPEDSQALAYAAQAEYLASGRVLNERAQLYAEQALAIDPNQRTALGLLGMVFFEQQNYRAAIEYWQRLIATEPPGSANAKMISDVIAQAKQRMGASGAESAVALESPAEGGPVTPGVTVAIEFPEGAVFANTDTVFVLARAANAASRMPIAVQRLQASQLPVTLRLDDSNSMAGQKLSAQEAIVVAVQVSPSGQPGESAASWLGAAGPLKPTLSETSVRVELQSK